MRSELSQVINQMAHLMAARSFNAIRLRLREQARALARQGKRPDEVLRAIEGVDMRDLSEPSIHPK